MKPEMHQKLAREPFEEKIRKYDAEYDVTVGPP